MTLAECLEKVTHREFLTWKEHWKNEWSIPSKDNWYAMQIAATIMRSVTEKPELVKTEKYKLVFESEKQNKSQEEGGITKQEIIDARKKMWMSKVGYKQE